MTGVPVMQTGTAPLLRVAGKSPSRSANDDAAALFGKVLDETLKGLRDTTRDDAGPADRRVDPAGTVELNGAEPAGADRTPEARTELEPAAAPGTESGPDVPASVIGVGSLLQATVLVRASPGAQLQSVIALNGLATPGAISAPAAGVRADEAVSLQQQSTPALTDSAVARWPISQDSRSARGPEAPRVEATPPREPVPVVVVSATSHPPPAPPVPAQIALALAGDAASLSTSPFANGPSGQQPPVRLLTIALDPPELGSVIVRLKLTGRGLEVAVAVQAHAVPTVREGLGEIARLLHAQGIAVEALNVRMADMQELATAVAAAARPDTAAAVGQQHLPQALANSAEPGLGGRLPGEASGGRRGPPDDGRAQRFWTDGEGRETDGSEGDAFGRVGAGGGRYV